MGLLDVLNGMQNGPRGPSTPSAPSESGGGMSPMTMAILGLLAWKAVKHLTAGQAGAVPEQAPKLPGGNVTASLPGGGGAGGLSDLLKGGLGGLLGGAAAGSVLSGGLGNLLQGFQDSGHGHTADSWVGTGPNKAIAPNDLADALGSDTLDTLSQQTGMGRNDLLEALRHQLPGFVDQLTPHGRIPSEDEASRMV